MNLKSSYLASLLLLTLFISSQPTSAQVDSFPRVINLEFPNSWDANRDLRKRNGKVLAWKHTIRDNYFEAKSCITLVFGPDSTGKVEYFVGKMYTDEKPFTKWHYGFTHYANYFVDSATGISFGFNDLHLEKYNHKPTEEELYSLLQKWKYIFFEKNSKTIEAGIDEDLWLETFGFLPDKRKFIKSD